MNKFKKWQNGFLLILALIAGLSVGLLIKQALTVHETEGPDPAALETASLDLSEEEARYQILKAQNEELENRKKVLLNRFGDNEDLAGVLDEFHENALLAGMSGVEGRGIILSLDDKINYDPLTYPIESIIHDSTINYVLNLLWAGGAREVAFNGIRLTAVSEISCVGPTILCYGVRQMPPYVIEAIGPVEDLEAVLYTDSYLAHLTQNKIGVRLTVQKSETVRLPSFSQTHDYLPYINWLREP